MSSPSQRKRRNKSESSDDEPVNKSQRITASEFRTKLKGSDPIEALKQLLRDDKEKNIEEYITHGGNISELLAILNNFDVKKNIPQAIPVFQAITIFIIKSTSCFPEKHKELVEECRQLLSIHLSLFHSMLTAVYSPRQKKVALKLFTALVSCDQELAWKILTSLKLTHQDIEALAFARKLTDPTSVREHFIKFLLAFLIDQPVELIRKFLGHKGLLVSIFSGLKADDYQDVIMVLTALKSSIVDNKNINKSQKLAIFNTASLCHLVGIYSWDPRSNEYHPQNAELKEEVRRCVHELLVVLLTSVKMGVVFNDPSLGTSYKEFNELVTTVIDGFGKPWGDDLREDLFVKMLSACPDVVKPAYRQIDSFLSSMDSPKWIQGINFFTKFVSNLDINVSLLPAKARTNLIKTIFVPSFLMNKLIQSLQSTQANDRLTALSCLCTCLKKLYSQKQWYIPAAINNYLLSNVSCAENLLENVEFFCSENRINNKESISGLVSTLDCLLCSFKICPQLLDSVRFKNNHYETLKKCLNAIKDRNNSKECKEAPEYAMETNNENPDFVPEHQSEVEVKLALLKVIELLLIIWPMDSSQENFEFWLEDLSDCICPHPDIVEESLSVIEHILGSTGYFLNHYKKELDLWMYCLSKHLSVDSVKLIVQSIKCASVNTKAIYTDLLAAEQLMTIQEQSTSLTLTLEDYINASCDGDKNVEPRVGNTFSLSVPLLSMLKVLHEGQLFQSSESFIVSLVVHLVHLQPSSEMFLAILKLYNKSSAASVLEYAESWSKWSGIVLSFPSAFDEESAFYKASCYLTENSLDLPDLSKLNEFELELLMSQTLYYSARGSQHQLSSNLLSLILQRSPKLVPFGLNYQPLIDLFHPRRDHALNSTLIVMTLIEFSENEREALLPYQHRLAMELRYALSKKSALKNCFSSIGKVLNVVKLTEVDTKYLLKKSFPLPTLLAQKYSEWQPIHEFLLKEGIRLNIKLKIESISSFLNEIFSIIPSYSTDDDLTFLNTIGSYLKYHYSETIWSEEMIETISGLLKAVISSKVWSENLAEYLYRFYPVDLTEVPLNRISILMDQAVTKLLPEELSNLLYVHKTELMDLLTSSAACHWSEKLSSSLLKIQFDDNDTHLASICKAIKKNKNNIYLSTSNMEMIYNLFFKANENIKLFSIIQSYLQQPSFLENHSLGECLVDILERLIPKEGCCLNVDMVKILLSAGLNQPFPRHIKLLQAAVKVGHTELPPKEIFGLLTSHSQFLNTLLSKLTDIKYEVLVLLEILLQNDASLIKSSHLPVYFSAYNATLSLHDQVLLKIIKMYEESGVDLTKFKPYIWGEAAAQRYSVSDQRKRLDDDESGCPTIQLLDIDMIQNTITYFPSERTFDISEVVEVHKGNEIYDVVLLLGALSQAVGPNSPMYPSQIASSGVISLAFLSLGSKCPIVRASGYHIIHRHYTSLTKRKDDLLSSHLVEKLQRSVCGTENARLSGIFSVFLARASLIMTEPFHPLFKPVHKFILVKSEFDLKAIPAFLEFFHSSDTVNGKILQTWILSVIKDGLRDQDDLQIVLSTLTLKLLLDFYCSKLVTPKTQVLIEEILEKCISCDSKRQLLVQDYSIIPWLVFVKKHSKALETIPSSHRYAPLKEFIKHRLQISNDDKTEEKQMDNF